ncbi:sugar transferase [Intestinimonas massiliensis (ex Afouda et al. 2020)]|uniref:sugar transferase n=1 Tax=Intestinimonas massiliensis (ex Afouda et al. 2020) TaxID=1673721 RepID=UPI00103259A3|nr:sugar transferase [Intestinimonas massiliensis (ex Afouda et al. 2020)]
MNRIRAKNRARRELPAGLYKRYIKRILDVSLSLVGMTLFCWLYLLLALAVKAEDPKGPVLFRQERLGRYGQRYWMYKFRSMRVGAEHTGSGVYSGKGDPRVTKVGRILRATSLDELPQLWNVVRGDMSLIGFRSPLTYHPWPWEAYTPEQRKMFSVRPGITGWAQVNGRKTVEWNRRIELNVWYAQHVTFLLDVKILFLTVWKVLASRDNLNEGATVGEGKAAGDHAQTNVHHQSAGAGRDRGTGGC